MFLHILAHNLKYRVVHFTYYRSKETISRQFNNVLRAVMKVSGEYLKFQDHNNLEGSEAYKWRWFQNSIGALDGTHIPVTVAAEDKPRYRKGDISTNVLGVCGPDLKLCCVCYLFVTVAAEDKPTYLFVVSVICFSISYVFLVYFCSCFVLLCVLAHLEESCFQAFYPININ
ncbi:uncharacterized protein LOC130723942 [Lotus japonicus]|uniref:uncharacterized protein LOC130723942 n=1 Tax=Lotus japonicus TaxID=34305 RepID=UPI002587046E|nr:uncharacterized protein LOC130723942 [Lotus japonicus]